MRRKISCSPKPSVEPRKWDISGLVFFVCGFVIYESNEEEVSAGLSLRARTAVFFTVCNKERDKGAANNKVYVGINGGWKR